MPTCVTSIIILYCSCIPYTTPLDIGYILDRHDLGIQFTVSSASADSMGGNFLHTYGLLVDRIFYNRTLRAQVAASSNSHRQAKKKEKSMWGYTGMVGW
jgi:hypothetical protein